METKTQNTEVQSQVKSTGGSYFGIKERGSSLKTEIIAGIIIFMAMFYIVPVQGAMMAGALYGAPGSYEWAVAFASIGIITAITAGVTTIIMGLYGKHPLALASGMGVNAFVAYTLMAGPNGMSYAAAMSAVLISGLIFIAISVTPIRGRILGAIPDDLKKAISIGVGLFLLFVALVNGGIIVQGGGTPTELGVLSDPFVILSIFAIFITLILWIINVEGAVLIGMGTTIVLGLVFNWSGLTGSQPLPSLDMDWSLYGASFVGMGDYIGQSLIGLGNVDQTWANPTWYLAIFVLFLNDFFDTAGTLFGVNASMPDVIVEEDTEKRVLIVDAIGTTFGSIMGATNVTIFAESTSGVNYGGRTGVTSITTGILFLLSVPIIPMLSPIMTSSVTVGAIVLIGVMMASQLKDINVEDKVYLTSTIFTIMFMILGYSIGTGIVIGLLTFIILMLITGRWKEMDWMLIASSPLFLAFLILPLLV